MLILQGIFLYLVLYLPWFRGYIPNVSPAPPLPVTRAQLTSLVPQMAAVCPFTNTCTRMFPSVPRRLLPESDAQALTLTILLGWTSYVVSLSQAGKTTPLNALGDALKGVGNGDSALLSGQRGLGVFKSMAGGA